MWLKDRVQDWMRPWVPPGPSPVLANSQSFYKEPAKSLESVSRAGIGDWSLESKQWESRWVKEASQGTEPREEIAEQVTLF